LQNPFLLVKLETLLRNFSLIASKSKQKVLKLSFQDMEKMAETNKAWCKTQTSVLIPHCVNQTFVTSSVCIVHPNVERTQIITNVRQTNIQVKNENLFLYLILLNLEYCTVSHLI
jgi:hypothetical protein